MNTKTYLSHAANVSFGGPHKLAKKNSPIDDSLLSFYQDDSSIVSLAIDYLSQGRQKIKELTSNELKNILHNFIKNIEARSEELTLMISSETGKVLWDAKSEVNALKSKAIQTLEIWENQAFTKLTDALPNVQGEVKTKPLGIVSVLGPYNFPMHLPNGQIIPALLNKNSVLFKPSELTPGCAELYCQLWWDSGLPSEALALVHGQREAGIQATSHSKINGIFFTGSVPTGIAIQKAIASTPQKLLALEMGGVNPLVIWQDAHIEAATHAAITGVCLTTGQRCTATRRILIHQDIYEKAKEQLIQFAQKIKIGLPSDAVFCGPLISVGAKQKFYAARQKLLNSGSKLLFEHTLPSQLPTTGGFVPSSILEDGDIKSFVQEETFAPIVVLEPIKNMQEVIEKCAWSPYGLSASIFTQQKTTYQEFWEGIQAGVINCNQPTNGASGKLPFGGLGLSGNHRPAGASMIEHCYDKIASLINPNPENLLKQQYIGFTS